MASSHSASAERGESEWKEVKVCEREGERKVSHWVLGWDQVAFLQ